MLIEELVPGINLETKNTEFKGLIDEGASDSGKNREISWLKTLVGFANTEGGQLYIGVDNKSHQIVALDHETADKTILMIHRNIRERVEPAIDYEISSIPYPGSMPTRYVLKVSVPMSRNLPVSLHVNGLLGIYVRNFGQTTLATSEQIRELILLSDNLPYDQPITDQLFRWELFSKLKSRVAEFGESLTEKELISIGFMNQNGQLSKGALLFSDQCNDIRTKVTASAWPGISKGSDVVLAAEEYIGNLLDVIRSSIQFIQNRSANGFRKEPDGRIAYISYPLRSITEGIVNAVGHRNYFIQGTQIEINLFQDRLEITSPGALLGVRELKKEKNISSIIPRRRNEVICAILEKCRYMEEKGSGFDKIEADYSGYGEDFLPYISADATSFTLTLPDLTKQGVFEKSSTQLREVYVESVLEGKNDMHILSFCYAKPRTVKEIAQEVHVQSSTYFRKLVLGRLVAQDLLLTLPQNGTIQYQSNPEKVKVKF